MILGIFIADNIVIMGKSAYNKVNRWGMFHDRVRERMKSSGIIVRELSMRSGISPRTIENWLSKNPTMPI